MNPEDLGTLSATDLEGAIATQKEDISRFEAEFIPMRQRYERLRGRLRALEAEVTRRALSDQGITARRPQRRGGVLISDVLAGRDHLDANRPFSTYRYYSLGRQEIYLNRAGVAGEQGITLYNLADRQPQVASAFGEVTALRAAGLTLGVPGVPMERQGVYYVGEAKPGWLRLDQIFVEDPTEQ